MDLGVSLLRRPGAEAPETPDIFTRSAPIAPIELTFENLDILSWLSPEDDHAATENSSGGATAAVSAPAPVAREEPTVRDFLQSAGLGAFADAFDAAGADDLQQLVDDLVSAASDADAERNLEELADAVGMVNEADKTRLLEALMARADGADGANGAAASFDRTGGDVEGLFLIPRPGYRRDDDIIHEVDGALATAEFYSDESAQSFWAGEQRRAREAKRRRQRQARERRGRQRRRAPGAASSGASPRPVGSSLLSTMKAGRKQAHGAGGVSPAKPKKAKAKKGKRPKPPSSSSLAQGRRSPRARGKAAARRPARVQGDLNDDRRTDLFIPILHATKRDARRWEMQAPGWLRRFHQMQGDTDRATGVPVPPSTWGGRRKKW